MVKSFLCRNIPAYAGKTRRGPLVGLLRGNIPAYAGKTQDAELWAIGP